MEFRVILANFTLPLLLLLVLIPVSTFDFTFQAQTVFKKAKNWFFMLKQKLTWQR